MISLLQSTNNWCINIDKGLLNGVIFIDLKKAFDTSDHEIYERSKILSKTLHFVFLHLNVLPTASFFLADFD